MSQTNTMPNTTVIMAQPYTPSNVTASILENLVNDKIQDDKDLRLLLLDCLNEIKVLESKARKNFPNFNHPLIGKLEKRIASL